MYEYIIGKVTHYYGKIGVGVIKLSRDIKLGDNLHYKGDNIDFEQELTVMQLNHKDVSKARIGDSIGIKLNQKVYVDDLVFRIEE